MRYDKFAFPLILVIAMLITGCGGESYELVPVSGTVTLDDEPLAGATVQFQPIGGESGDPGPGSAGRTNAEGRFELETQTSPRQSGAVAGMHRVRIYSFSPETPLEGDVDTQRPVERVPERYNYRSSLTFPVPEGGTDEADFDLTTARER